MLPCLSLSPVVPKSPVFEPVDDVVIVTSVAPFPHLVYAVAPLSDSGSSSPVPLYDFAKTVWDVPTSDATLNCISESLTVAPAGMLARENLKNDLLVAVVSPSSRATSHIVLVSSL